jgi:SWI/SNF-related matrix-associated actin-dependent regulator of chromatin subfamily A3
MKKIQVLTRCRYTQVITGETVAERPSETGGGILADEMGLGKTLTMLSAIAETTNEAILFANGTARPMNLDIENTRIPSKATLVVVPSPRMWRITTRCIVRIS